jgi:hypothetical protein
MTIGIFAIFAYNNKASKYKQKGFFMKLFRMARFSLLIFGIFSASFARENFAKVENESSKYGKFNFVQINDSCMITFTYSDGKKYEVIKHGYCSADGFNHLIPINKIGDKTFPITDSSGNEIHLFETPTAGGGNACSGSTFWIVYILKSNIWYSDAFGACDFIDSYKSNDDKHNCVLSFSMHTGIVYETKFGSLLKKDIIPIGISFRKAILGNGLVLTIKSKCNHELSLFIKVKNEEAKEEKSFKVVLPSVNSFGTTEIGHKEGWAFSKGEKISIQCNEYEPINIVVP